MADSATASQSVTPKPPPGFVPEEQASSAPVPPPGFVPEHQSNVPDALTKQTQATARASGANPKSTSPILPFLKSTKEQSTSAMIGEGEQAGAQGNAQMGQQYVQHGPKEMYQGGKDVARGNVAHGLNRIISGLGVTAIPAVATALPFTAMTAPLSTATGIASSVAGGYASKKGAEYVGADPDQAELAGNLGGMAAGYLGGQAPSFLKGPASRALLLGRTPEDAYQSALKPSTTLSEADRAAVVQTGLKEGIPVSKTGAEKVSDLIDNLNQQVSDVVQTDPTRPINKFSVASRLAGTAKRFATQVNPENDMNAVADAGNEFIRNQQGSNIPAENAQAMKQGTYRVLGGKSYGEVKSASSESQKALARGLKEELATQFPELSGLNAREGGLLDLQDQLERAVNRIGNHQLLGIGTPIAAGATKAITGSGKLAAAVGVIKAVLDNPSVKSQLAISLSRAGVPPWAVQSRISAYVGALSRQYLDGLRGTPDASSNQSGQPQQ
jgi:hypothetical protein